jgi:hypothetical protein
MVHSYGIFLRRCSHQKFFRAPSHPVSLGTNVVDVGILTSSLASRTFRADDRSTNATAILDLDSRVEVFKAFPPKPRESRQHLISSGLEDKNCEHGQVSPGIFHLPMPFRRPRTTSDKVYYVNRCVWKSLPRNDENHARGFLLNFNRITGRCNPPRFHGHSQCRLAPERCLRA